MYYHSIQPGKWVVVQSFAGHLWIAINSVTKERLLIKNKSIWVCEPWNKNGTTAQDKRPVLLCVTVPGSLKPVGSIYLFLFEMLFENIYDIVVCHFVTMICWVFIL